MNDDWDDSAGAAHQLELEQRRRDEDEALERCRVLTAQWQAEWAEYEKWCADRRKRAAA